MFKYSVRNVFRAIVVAYRKRRQFVRSESVDTAESIQIDIDDTLALRTQSCRCEVAFIADCVDNRAELQIIITATSHPSFDYGS